MDEKNLVCCGTSLDRESSGNRDTETMGGLFIEYFRCSKCKQGYDLILDSLDGDMLRMNDSNEADYKDRDFY